MIKQRENCCIGHLVGLLQWQNNALWRESCTLMTHIQSRGHPKPSLTQKETLPHKFNLREQNNKINTIFLEQTIITRNISTKYVSLPFEIKSVLIKSLHVMASLCFDLFLSMCFKPNMLKSGPGYDKKVKRSDVNAQKGFLLHHSAQY